MVRQSKLTDERLDALYIGKGFGGDRTMRAAVIRGLIDEIRELRRQGATPGRDSRVPPEPDDR